METRGPQTAYLCLGLMDGAPLLTKSRQKNRSKWEKTEVLKDVAERTDLVDWFRITRRNALKGYLSSEKG